MLRFRTWFGHLGVGLVLALGVLLVSAGTAGAAFPGRNGLLAVVQGDQSGTVLLVSPNGRVERSLCEGSDSCGGRASDIFVDWNARVAWSPDGRALAVDVGLNRHGGGYGVALFYPDGSCLNCQLLFFAAGAGFTPNPNVVTVTDAQGHLADDGVDGLATGPLLARGSYPAWSAHRQLALVRAGWVWVGRPGRLHRLARGKAPSWSPSGKQIVFVSHGWLTIGNAQGRSLRRLVQGSAPAWSPDGTSIAFFGPSKRLRVIRLRDLRVRDVGAITGRAVDWQPIPSKHPTRCLTPRGSRVIASSAEAELTERLRSNGVATMGCLFANGRSRALTSYGFNPSGSYSVGPVALAGKYAAVTASTFGTHYGNSVSEVSVFDLQTGVQVPARGGQLAGCPGYGAPCTSPVDRLVLGADAVSAFHTTSVDSGCTCTVETIQASDSTGLPTLDSVSEPNGSPASLTNLKLTGDTLTWDHNGTPHSAQLQP